MRGPILRALVLLSCAVLVALALVGCTEEPVALTEADAEKAVTLRVEQQLVVTLGSNPSTGYSWVLQMDPEGFLTLDSSGYEPGPQVPGSGGQQRFRFTARRSGRTTLAFTSGRPPEPPVRTIRYLVLVE